MSVNAGRFLLGSTALAALASALPMSQAFAQQATSGQAVSTPPNAITEVVVTAQKRNERLQDVPLSVTALNSQSLVEQNLVSLQDYATRVPGLTYSGTEQGDLAIRGITTGFGTNPTVATLIDDVPFGSSTAFPQADTLDLDPADISQVEILRGPQGTLYGASSLGGLIKYTTIAPNPNRYTATAESDYESSAHGGDGYAFRGTANVPVLQDLAAVRVSGFYRTDPSFGYNALDNLHDPYHDHEYGWRASMLVHPIQPLTITLSALDQHNRSFGTEGEEFVDGNYKPLYGNYGFSSAGEYSYDTDRLYTGRAVYDLHFATATSITAYSQFRGSQNDDLTEVFADVIPALSYVGVNVPSTDRSILENDHSTSKWSEEFRLTSNSNTKFEWLVGGFWTFERSNNPQILNATGSGSDINVFTGLAPSHYQEYAGFADLTYHFTPKFDIQVGGRVAHNDQSFSNIDSGPLQILETGAPTSVTSGTSSETAGTWLVTPSYHFTRDLMVYVRIATGYRPGGPNLPAPGVPDTFHSDTTTNYEGGIKGEFFDHRVRFDADIFWIDWSNIQLLNTDVATGFGYYTNGSSARSRGFEGSVDYKPLPGLTLGANGSFTDASLTQNLPTSAAASPVYGVSGDRLPYAAKWIGNLSAEQDFNIVANTVLYVGGNLSYTSGRLGDFTDSPSDPRVMLPGYGQLDLHGGLRRDGYAINVFVKNATDHLGFYNGFYQTSFVPSAGYRLDTIRPRTIGVNLTGRF